jgi:hypothetical protein
MLEVSTTKGHKMWLELIPAYGRDYKNQAEVKKAWNEQNDFLVAPFGPHINKQDAEREGANIIIRYDRLRKVVGI